MMITDRSPMPCALLISNVSMVNQQSAMCIKKSQNNACDVNHMIGLTDSS